MAKTTLARTECQKQVNFTYNNSIDDLYDKFSTV